MLVYHRSIKEHMLEEDSPLLGFQNFSMPCLISTMRDSSVNDSMTLKLQRGLTSKNVMPFFSAYARACSVGTCRLNARCSRLPTRIRGTPGACWGKTRDKKVGYKRGMGGPERWERGRYTVLSGWVNLKQCHSWPVSFIYSMRPVISVPFSSPQRKEHSPISRSCTEQPQVGSNKITVKAQIVFFESWISNNAQKDVSYQLLVDIGYWIIMLFPLINENTNNCSM